MFATLVRVVDRLEDVALFGACLCLLATMLTVTLDVVMRYGFNAPLGWVYDLVSQYLMVGAFFLAVSETLRRGGHVAVDVFRHAMSRPVRRVLDIVTAVLILPVLLAMVVTGWDSLSRAFIRGEMITGVVTWPTWASYIFVPIGIGLLLIRVTVHLVDLLRGGPGHVPDVVAPDAPPPTARQGAAGTGTGGRP